MGCRHRMIAILVALVASASPAPAQLDQQASELRQKLIQVALGLDSAYRRGDAVAVAGLFTDDAIVSPFQVDDLRGRVAIQAGLRGFFAANTVAAFQLQPVEVEVCGATAYDRGTFVWSSAPRGGQPTTVRGRYSAVWTRNADGDWRIHRYIENLVPQSTPR